jgi:hypothetical protein
MKIGDKFRITKECRELNNFVDNVYGVKMLYSPQYGMIESIEEIPNFDKNVDTLYVYANNESLFKDCLFYDEVIPLGNINENNLKDIIEVMKPFGI